MTFFFFLDNKHVIELTTNLPEKVVKEEEDGSGDGADHYDEEEYDQAEVYIQIFVKFM